MSNDSRRQSAEHTKVLLRPVASGLAVAVRGQIFIEVGLNERLQQPNGASKHKSTKDHKGRVPDR